MLRVRGARVAVTPDAVEELSAGGIVLPEGSRKKPTTGTVTSVGPGVNLDLVVGDRVRYVQGSGQRIDDMVVLGVADVLGTL